MSLTKIGLVPMWRISVVGVRIRDYWTLRRIPKSKKEARNLIMNKMLNGGLLNIILSQKLIW
jgi:hypothetical protein